VLNFGLVHTGYKRIRSLYINRVSQADTFNLSSPPRPESKCNKHKINWGFIVPVVEYDNMASAANIGPDIGRGFMSPAQV